VYGRALSTCGVVNCWETRLGGGGPLPHAHYALVALLAFAITFPSLALVRPSLALRVVLVRLLLPKLLLLLLLLLLRRRRRLDTAT